MSATACRLLFAVLLFGCGGGGQTGSQPAARPAGERTEAVLVGPLCQGEACRCREGDDDAGEPPAGNKRFEVRLGTSDDALWATVDGMVLYKSPETPDACFYIDFRPGQHKVDLRGKGDSAGLTAAIAIAEQGGAQDATWWYRTFDFQCGSPGRCDRQAMESWKSEIAGLGGKHDPCGSTKVWGITWESERAPEQEQPDELKLAFTLDVYKFAPANPPGSNECDVKDEGAAE